jgi:hypothetical protein
VRKHLAVVERAASVLRQRGVAIEELTPRWSIGQFSEIRIPIRFHKAAADVFPDRAGLVIRAGDGKPAVEAVSVVLSPAEAHA